MTKQRNNHDDRQDYLKHEYDNATRHYFYEGDLMLKRNQFFVALNLGMFTIMGLVSRGENGLIQLAPIMLPALCLLGALISKYWIVMTKRAGYYIFARVARIKEIEKELGYKTMTISLNMKADAEPATMILFERLGRVFMWGWIILFLILITYFGLHMKNLFI